MDKASERRRSGERLLSNRALNEAIQGPIESSVSSLLLSVSRSFLLTPVTVSRALEIRGLRAEQSLTHTSEAFRIETAIVAVRHKRPELGKV